MVALRRTTAALLATLLTVTFALVWTAPPAHADEAWETALKGLMNRTATWAEGGLSRIGALAQPLPLLDASPGALVQADELARTAADALADDLTRDVDLGGGTRLTSTVTEEGGDHLLDVLLTTKRQIAEEDLAVAGVTVADAVDVTGWATLHLRARHTAAGETYLVRDGDAPRIDIDAVARFRGDLDEATASVGILGVTLTGGSTLEARTHLKVTLTDPNGDGRLAFDTPSGAGTGELGAAGSLAGLAQVALDNSGGGRISDTETEPGPGSLHAVVKLGAATSGVPVALPPIAATVTVDWNDISVGTPTVTTTGLDETIGRFRSMSPLDLATGLAQLATLIGGVQQSGPAGNLDLPFLRGTVADAVKVNEKIVAFLREHVHPRPEDPHFQPGVDDPAKAGQPKFESIQELFTLLAAEGLPVDGVSFADDKLVFRVKLEHEATAEVPLDPGAPSVSGRGPPSRPTASASTATGSPPAASSASAWSPARPRAPCRATRPTPSRWRRTGSAGSRPPTARGWSAAPARTPAPSNSAAPSPRPSAASRSVCGPPTPRPASRRSRRATRPPSPWCSTCATWATRPPTPTGSCCAPIPPPRSSPPTSRSARPSTSTPPPGSSRSSWAATSPWGRPPPGSA